MLSGSIRTFWSNEARSIHLGSSFFRLLPLAVEYSRSSFFEVLRSLRKPTNATPPLSHSSELRRRQHRTRHRTLAGSTEGTSGVTRISTRNAGGISRAQNRIPNLGKGCAAGLLRRLEGDVLNSLSSANSVGNCFPISTAHFSKGTTTDLPPELSIHRTLTMDVENNNIYT